MKVKCQCHKCVFFLFCSGSKRMKKDGNRFGDVSVTGDVTVVPVDVELMCRMVRHIAALTGKLGIIMLHVTQIVLLLTISDHRILNCLRLSIGAPDNFN